jgi:acyl carrier protein
MQEGTLNVMHEWKAATKVVPIDFSSEPLTSPGVLERQLVTWLKRECELDDLTWNTPLMDLGINSLKGVELGNALSLAFNHSFPATLLIDNPSVKALADLIRRDVLKVQPETVAPPPPQQVTVTRDALLESEIDALDTSALDALLNDTINEVLKGGKDA